MVSVKEEMTAAETCKSRLQELNKWCQHLKEVDTSSSAATLWKKKQLDKMLVEYFLRLRKLFQFFLNKMKIFKIIITLLFKYFFKYS